jgi:heat shock protein HslJ
MVSCGGGKTINPVSSNLPGGSYKIIQVRQMPDSEITAVLNLDFTQKRVFGNTGCNDFSGNLVLMDNRPDYFSVDALITTKMYCSDAAMALEYILLGHIGKELRWVQSGDTLSLFQNPSNRVMMAVKTKNQ